MSSFYKAYKLVATKSIFYQKFLGRTPLRRENNYTRPRIYVGRLKPCVDDVLYDERLCLSLNKTSWWRLLAAYAVSS